jgi:hypothetical protein
MVAHIILGLLFFASAKMLKGKAKKDSVLNGIICVIGALFLATLYLFGGY